MARERGLSHWRNLVRLQDDREGLWPNSGILFARNVFDLLQRLQLRRGKFHRELRSAVPVSCAVSISQIDWRERARGPTFLGDRRPGGRRLSSQGQPHRRVAGHRPVLDYSKRHCLEVDCLVRPRRDCSPPRSFNCVRDLRRVERALGRRNPLQLRVCRRLARGQSRCLYGYEGGVANNLITARGRMDCGTLVLALRQNEITALRTSGAAGS